MLSLQSNLCVQQPPLQPEKSGCLTEVPNKSKVLDWSLINDTGRC
jgi:hypothetical protein